MSQPPLLRAILFYPSDDPFDATSACKPLNPLRVKCAACSFPDYSHVPEPYLLRRAAMNASGDFTLGHEHRLLVKERLKSVLELVAPESCTFHPTYAQRTSQQTPWFLGVPLHECEPNIKSFKEPLRCCPACGEPFARHVNMIADMDHDYRSAFDVSALAEWHCWERPQGEMFRMALLSVRLIVLLKKLRFRGIYPSADVPALDTAEQDWVAKNYAATVAAGLAGEPAAASPTAAERKWFAKWLKGRREKPAAAAPTLKDLEQKHGVTLPPEYHEFAQASGAVIFDDVEDSGLEVILLPPGKLDFKNWRKGALQTDDPESGEVDAVMFAETNCGDVFCFDLATKKTQPPVVRYNHELDCYEEYADSFVACLRRFANAVR